MDHFSGLQLLGYAASLLIATSLLMRSIVRLRVINLMGAATFSVYGFLIGAYPVGVLNLMTATINIVQLIRLQRRSEIFRVLEIRPNAPYLQYFLEFQANDIAKFFPKFHYDLEASGDRLAIFVLRDLVPAGVLLATKHGNRLDIQLDYVIPQFRDLKIGRFLFLDEAEFFRKHGIREIVSPADTKAHAEYLERIGFVKIEEGVYRLTL